MVDFAKEEDSELLRKGADQFKLVAQEAFARSQAWAPATRRLMLEVHWTKGEPVHRDLPACFGNSVLLHDALARLLPCLLSCYFCSVGIPVV